MLQLFKGFNFSPQIVFIAVGIMDDYEKLLNEKEIEESMFL